MKNFFSWGRLNWREVVLSVVALSFIVWWEWPLAFWPFQQDDSSFLGVMHPLRLADVALYFSPFWGWVYRPLFLLYFGAVLRGFGPDPVAFHLIGIALHLGITVLLGWVCYRLISRGKESDEAVTTRDKYLSLGCGALFFVWQGRSEPLQAASCTSTLLAVWGCLLAIHAWLSWKSSGNVAFCAMTLIFLFASLGAKEEGIILPFLLLILDNYFPDRRPQSPPIQRGQSLAAYSIFAMIIAGFALLSLQAQKSITPDTIKIVSVPRSIEPFTIASFYLILWWDSFYTGWGFISTLIVALFCLYLHRLGNRELKGAFYLSFAPCVGVPLMTGTYALGADRFFYFPRLCLVLAVALSLAFSPHLLRLLLTRLGKKPLFLSAVVAGWMRAGVTMLLINKVFFDFDTSNRILDLFTDRIFMPFVSGVVLLAAFSLFRKGRIAGNYFGLLGIIAISNLWRWSFTNSMQSPIVPLIALALIALLFHWQGANWLEGILAGAALWQIPALSLPLFLGLFLLRNSFSSSINSFPVRFLLRQPAKS